MVWSTSWKLIFIHIPKCGGTTVEYALNLKSAGNGYGVVDGKALQHWTWKEYKECLGKNYFERFHKFSICRDPYTRIISEYYWSKSIGHGLRFNSIDEFIDYCEDVVKREAYNETLFSDHYMPQHLFIYNEQNELMVDKLYKFEEYEEVGKYLAFTFGVVIGKHEAGRYPQTELTQEQRDRIYNIYKKDFDLLGYKR